MATIPLALHRSMSRREQEESEVPLFRAPRKDLEHALSSQQRGEAEHSDYPGSEVWGSCGCPSVDGNHGEL